MIERVHEHIIEELQQNTRTDIIFIVTAILLNLIILAVNSIIAADNHSVTTTIVMILFVCLLIVINLIVIFGLLKGRQTRVKLINGLLKMYRDQNVEGYYDVTLLSNYNTRYNLFILAVVFLGIIAIIVPFITR
ncbi:MAG: hypothetical protein PHQ86_03785 [Dehalococcoidales bacterium]|nr:hypothetical protein [Dehalococcoidales bacterium]